MLGSEPTNANDNLTIIGKRASNEYNRSFSERFTNLGRKNENHTENLSTFEVEINSVERPTIICSSPFCPSQPQQIDSVWCVAFFLLRINFFPVQFRRMALRCLDFRIHHHWRLSHTHVNRSKWWREIDKDILWLEYWHFGGT